jgi:hypothetical protein
VVAWTHHSVTLCICCLSCIWFRLCFFHPSLKHSFLMTYYILLSS